MPLLDGQTLTVIDDRSRIFLFYQLNNGGHRLNVCLEVVSKIRFMLLQTIRYSGCDRPGISNLRII